MTNILDIFNVGHLLVISHNIKNHFQPEKKKHYVPEF